MSGVLSNVIFNLHSCYGTVPLNLFKDTKDTIYLKNVVTFMNWTHFRMIFFCLKSFE